MISDFKLLFQKVSQLAELAHSLRRENAELRLKLVSLHAENADLTSRMHQAHQRVLGLLEKMPLQQVDEEVA